MELKCRNLCLDKYPMTGPFTYKDIRWGIQISLSGQKMEWP